MALNEVLRQFSGNKIPDPKIAFVFLPLPITIMYTIIKTNVVCIIIDKKTKCTQNYKC